MKSLTVDIKEIGAGAGKTRVVCLFAALSPGAS
jgi:hypothetical protein